LNDAHAPSPGLVFVGGAPRSGTTLLRRVLGAHPEIYAGPEFDLLPALVGLRDLTQAKVREGRISAITDEATVDAAFAGAVRAMLAPRAAREGARLYAEKTPHNVTVFPQLLELFPDAKLILMLRDPRAVVASMKEVSRRHRAQGETPHPSIRDVHASALEVARLLYRGFEALDAAPDRVLAVHYEDLVTDPGGEAQRLCAFLGVPFAPEMIRVEAAKHDHTEGEAAHTVTHWYTREEFERPVQADRLDVWRQALTAGEAGLVARLAPRHARLARYGLEMAPQPFATHALRARFRAERTMRHLGRAIARTLPK
jgi:hypothetical protein